MSGLPWFKCYPRDFNDGMVGLTLEERGAYITILNVIYARGGPVPDDAGYFRALLSCSGKTWAKVRASLIAKRKLSEVRIDGEPALMNRRAEAEIAGNREKSEKFSEAGRRGGSTPRVKANKNNGQGEATLKPRLSDTDTESEQIEDANASLSAGADAAGYPEPFDLAWKAYPHVKGRSSKRKAFGYWRRLGASIRAALPAAIARYARDGREPNEDCGAPAMERWLRDDRFADWLSDEPEPSVVELDPWPQRVREFRRNQYWNTTDWGPKPGKPGCIAPQSALEVA